MTTVLREHAELLHAEELAALEYVQKDDFRLTKGPAFIDRLHERGADDNALALFWACNMSARGEPLFHGAQGKLKEAGMRGRPKPGLDESLEAIQSVFCAGELAPLALLKTPLLIGGQMGTVPEGITNLPLQRDIEATQKRLRLKPAAQMRTRFVLFDTAVVDLTDQLSDPVDILFGTQLGGGTDVRKAIDYCAGHITRAGDTTMVLVNQCCQVRRARHFCVRLYAGSVSRSDGGLFIASGSAALGTGKWDQVDTARTSRSLKFYCRSLSIHSVAQCHGYFDIDFGQGFHSDESNIGSNNAMQYIVRCSN